MKSALVVVAALLLGAQQPTAPLPCDDCSDVGRPWMRGNREISCAHPDEIARWKEAHPLATYEACECQHSCDPNATNANENGGRLWDPACSAKCSPFNCKCEHPCEGDK